MSAVLDGVAEHRVENGGLGAGGVLGDVGDRQVVRNSQVDGVAAEPEHALQVPVLGVGANG